jgi:hypothetical protein
MKERRTPPYRVYSFLLLSSFGRSNEQICKQSQIQSYIQLSLGVCMQAILSSLNIISCMGFTCSPLHVRVSAMVYWCLLSFVCRVVVPLEGLWGWGGGAGGALVCAALVSRPFVLIWRRFSH